MTTHKLVPPLLEDSYSKNTCPPSHFMLVAEARQLGIVAEAHQLRALGKYISKVYLSNHFILSGTLLQGYLLLLNVWWC